MYIFLILFPVLILQKAEKLEAVMHTKEEYLLCSLMLLGFKSVGNNEFQSTVIKYKTLSVINKANQEQFAMFVFSSTDISLHMNSVC